MKYGILSIFVFGMGVVHGALYMPSSSRVKIMTPEEEQRIEALYDSFLEEHAAAVKRYEQEGQQRRLYREKLRPSVLRIYYETPIKKQRKKLSMATGKKQTTIHYPKVSKVSVITK